MPPVPAEEAEVRRVLMQVKCHNLKAKRSLAKNLLLGGGLDGIAKRLQEAELYLHQCIDGFEKITGKNSISRLISMVDLAQVYMTQGRISDAKEWQAKAQE